MKTKSSSRTVYVITAVLSVFVLLLAAAGFTNVEAQKVERVSADANFIKHADAAGELAASPPWALQTPYTPCPLREPVLTMTVSLAVWQRF